MPKLNFDQVVASIVAQDPRYHVNAYTFVREGLDFTLKKGKRRGKPINRHVSGGELLEGLRDYTVREFGPMGKMVLNEWGITRCEDFGEIVFNLVKSGVFGKSDEDSLEDFSGVYSFEEAFVKPFLPQKPAKPRRGSHTAPTRQLQKPAPEKSEA